MRTKVLVTGAGGLIGRYAVQALHDAGHQVIGWYRTPPDPQPPWQVAAGDLLDPASATLLTAIRPDAIVHCAAHLPQQFEGAVAVVSAQVNAQLDEAVIQPCRADPQCALVYLSTTSLYAAGSGPRRETDPLSAQGPYQAGKIATEARLAKLSNRTVILRINAPYAPDQRARTVLRIFIERACQGEPLLYYGEGRRSQDFTAAADVAEAICLSVSKPDAAGIFNIATGQPISMRELAELVVASVPGTSSTVRSAGQDDAQESYRAGFDIGKAERQLGWQPRTSLSHGIRQWVQYLEAGTGA